MRYHVSLWDLPRSAGGFHSFDSLGGLSINRVLSPFIQAQNSSGTACLPCAHPSGRCTLVEIRHQTLPIGTDRDVQRSIASPSAAHVLKSREFVPDLIFSMLDQSLNRPCSLVISLPHKDLERLGDLPRSGGLRSMSLTSTTAVVPLPSGMARHLTPLTTLLLCNILPMEIRVASLSALTTLSLVRNAESPTPRDYEYQLSDFFQLLLHTPQLQHLRLSGLGPTDDDVMDGWIVPLESLETLHLHYCLHEEILRHLSISLETREISIHTRVPPAPLRDGAVSFITASKWDFVPSRIDFYQEGTNSSRLFFAGTRRLRGGRDNLADFPVLTLEIFVMKSTLLPDSTFSGQCLRSFRSLSTANVQKLIIHSFRWPRGQVENPVCDLLKLLPALRTLELRGCNEGPFYEALSKILVNGRHGQQGRSVICPQLTKMVIYPIVDFERYLGDQTPTCRKLVEGLSNLVKQRKKCRARPTSLKIVFPPHCQREVQYVIDNIGSRVHVKTA